MGEEGCEVNKEKSSNRESLSFCFGYFDFSLKQIVWFKNECSIIFIDRKEYRERQNCLYRIRSKRLNTTDINRVPGTIVTPLDSSVIFNTSHICYLSSLIVDLQTWLQIIFPKVVAPIFVIPSSLCFLLNE